MLEKFREFNISKINIFNGCLRLSILTCLLAFLWCFFIEGPKHTTIAFGISDQDARDLRKAANIEIDGHIYSYNEEKEYKNGVKIENKYKIKNLDESYITDDDKNEIIQKYADYWHPYSSYNNYICSASRNYCDPVIDRAIKRIVKNETSLDYSRGYLVSNQKYGIKDSSWTCVVDDEHRVLASYSPNGFSIIPSLGEKIYWCFKTGALGALLMFFCTFILLPITFYIAYCTIKIPLILASLFFDYFSWMKNGFLNESLKEKPTGIYPNFTQRTGK